MPQNYRDIYNDRKKAGIAKQAPKDNNSMTIEGPNVIDESGDKMPKVPEKQGPTLPVDDSFKNLRTQKA